MDMEASKLETTQQRSERYIHDLRKEGIEDFDPRNIEATRDHMQNEAMHMLDNPEVALYARGYLAEIQKPEVTAEDLVAAHNRNMLDQDLGNILSEALNSRDNHWNITRMTRAVAHTHGVDISHGSPEPEPIVRSDDMDLDQNRGPIWEPGP